MTNRTLLRMATGVAPFALAVGTLALPARAAIAAAMPRNLRRIPQQLPFALENCHVS
jgi:hypothetical protein